MYGYYATKKPIKEVVRELEKDFKGQYQITATQVYDWTIKHYPYNAYLLAPEIIGYFWRYVKNHNINVLASTKSSRIKSSIINRLNEISKILEELDGQTREDKIIRR